MGSDGPETRPVQERLEARQAALAEIVRELAAIDDLERLLSVIAERVCGLLRVDSAALVLVQGDELVLRASYGFDDAIHARPPRTIDESRVGRVVRTRQPQISSDMAADPHWRDSAAVTRFGYRAILEVPLVLRQEVVGVLVALHKSLRVFSADDLALLTELAAHTTLALDRGNLVRGLRARLRETETLLSVSHAVSSAADLPEALRRVARETTRALGADAGGACLADPAGERLLPAAGYHVPGPVLEAFARGPIPLRGHRFFEEAWETRRPVFSSDAGADPRIDRETWARFPHRSILFFPIVVKEQRLGGLFVVWWERSRQVTPEDLRLVEGISRQAGLAIENARLHGETEQRRRETAVVAEIARTINASLELDTVLQRVAEAARDLCGSDMGRIALWDAQAKAMVFRNWVGSRYRGYDTVRIDADKGAGGFVVATGQPFRTERYEADPRITKDYLVVAREEGVVAELVVPIRIAGRVEGLLYVDNRSPRPFTDRDEAVLTRLADHAAIAITNARLYEETERRRRAAESLAEVGHSLSQSLDVSVVGRQIPEAVLALLRAKHSVLYRLVPDSGDLVALAVGGDVELPLGVSPVIPSGAGVAGLAVRERRPVVTSDILADPRVTLTEEMRARIEQAPFRVALAVPLLVQDRVIGALTVADRPGRVFGDEEVRLAQTFADQAALALEHARLFEEQGRLVDETLRQHAEALALEEVTREITASLDREEVFQRIVERARELCGTDLAFLAPYDREAGTAAIVAVSGARTDALGTLTIARGRGTGGLVLKTGEPFVTEDYLRDPRITRDYAEVVAQEGVVAQAVVPLRFRGVITGLLWVANRTARPFTPRDVGILTKLADQAAIAQENARLYAESKRRLAETQALLEVTELLGSTLEPRRLLKHVAIKTARVCQVDRCTIELWEAGRAVPLMAQFADGRRVAKLWQKFLTMPPYAPAEIPAHALALQTKQPVVIPDASDTDLIPREWVETFGLRAYLLVPLIRRGRVVGVMSLDYSDRPGAFQQWQVDLAVTIAQEVALALENTRLFEETRERLRESETLREVSQVLSRNLPRDEAMRRVARAVGRAFQVDMVGAYFLDGRREALVPIAGYRVPKDRLETFLRTPFPLARFAFLRDAWETRKPVWSSDYASDARFDQEFLAAFRPGALLFAPTPVRGEIAGGLFLVWWKPGRRFTPADLRLIEGVASQVGLALENADLVRQTEEKLQETETLLGAARALSATLDLQPLLRHFLRPVARSIECDAVGVWLVNPTSGHLEPFAGYRVPPALLEPVRRTWINLEESPLYAEAIAGRRAVASSNVPDDPRIPASLKAVAPHRTQLFAPVVVRGRLIGALVAVWWERAREFADRELTLVEAMASQAGAAIENARLFQDNQRKLGELSVLYELSRAVTGQLDVTELVQAIHREVGRVLDARNMAILLYDEEHREFEVALRVLEGQPDPNPVRRYRLGHGLMSVVVQRRQGLRTSDYAESCRREGVEPVRALLRFRHWLGVPMIAGDRVWGVLALRHTEHPFTEADEQLLTNIASLVALAVRSARLYEERTRAYGELASAQDRLVQAEKLRALGEMAGGVAHDFNNVLAVILGRTQLLLNQAQDPALRRHLELIQTMAMDGAQTVRRIQEVARMRRARPFQPVDLTAVVEEVVEVTRSRWKDEVQAHGHRVEVHVETRPVPEVAGDAAELREALTNLVFNALDAMPEGGRLALETGVEGDWVYCVVADTGVGMREEVRRRVFDPFFTTKGERGTGLGLSVVYGIVTRHGGEIDVRSEPGRGSAFTIRLPVATREVAAAGPTPAPPRPRTGARILVVEDEAEVRDVLVELLEAQGHTVTACGSGDAGVARVRAEPFDLVFTDLGMPGMSGWEVARLVRLARPWTPVALVTGWSDQIDAAEARSRGIDFLVAKPFETADVSVVVARALARGDRQPADPAAG